MTESRIPTGRTRSVGLFTIIAEELNSELSDQGGTWIRATGCESSAPTARPSCLPQGVGEEEKKERGLRERRKGFPFPFRFSPPLLLPFCPCCAGYNCLYMSDIVPLMTSLLLLSRTGFINRSVVAQLLSILWSPLFLKRLYIQWSILCPVNHPNTKRLLLHCMDSLMPRSCQCSLPISRYVLYFLCSDRARQSFRIIDKSLDWLALL